MEIRYQHIAKMAREMAEGDAVVLIILNGKHGNGYSVHADSGLRELLPSVLRRVAKRLSPGDAPNQVTDT